MLCLQPETRFKNQVRPRLDAIPVSFWIKIQLVSLRGIPDFIGLVRGRFVAIELKVPGNKPDALQAWTLRKIKDAGGLAYVMYPHNMEQIIKELRGI